MPQFLDKLCLTELTDDGDSLWQLCSEFRYQSNLIGLVVVPDGFVTDFASIPRIGFIYAMLGDTAHEPAVIHDYLYYTGKVSRWLADNVFLEAMKTIGMPAWRYYPIYWGVRAGGWVAWNEHRSKGDPQKMAA